MSGLVVHLQQALRTQQKLAALSQRSGDLAGALDAVEHGIIVVGSGCLVIHLNTAAENEYFAPTMVCISDQGQDHGDKRVHGP